MNYMSVVDTREENTIHVLLVEDNSSDLELIKRQLNKMDPVFEITVATEIEKIEEIVSTKPLDLVLSDYNLPTCTGLDVLQTVQKIKPNVVFVFITGTVNDEELAANTILSGASGFILKKNINAVHKRLEPFVQAVLRNKPIRSTSNDRITQSSAVLEEVRVFLNNFPKENLSHHENLRKIQEDLARLKKKYDNILPKK